jgi:hypothetical protein
VIFGAANEWASSANRVPAEQIADAVVKLVLPAFQTHKAASRIVDQCNIWLNRTFLNRSSGLMLCSTFDCRIAPCSDE